VSFLVLAAALAAVLSLWPRDDEVFRVGIRAGRARVLRGRVPAALLEAFADIARDARVRRADVRAVRTGSGPRLVVTGVDDRVAQRFRNAFGLHTGPPPAPPSGGRRRTG
jgi:hypothetical protein